MSGRKFLYFVVCVALAVLPLGGCSSSGGGGVASVATGEKGVSLTVQGSVDSGKSTAKTVGLPTDPLSGTVKALNAVDATVLGTAAIAADGTFSGLSFTLPATKSIIVFRADTNKSVTPFYAIVPIDLSNPPAPGIGASNAIAILINQASTNIASVVSSALGFSGVLPSTTPVVASGMLGDTGNALPAGQTYISVAQLVTQYGGQVLAYNTSGLALTGSLKDTLLPAQDGNTINGDELQTIVLDGQITGVSIPGNNPIVSFQVTNKATGKGIRGLKTFGLAIAQLKPAANGSPSEWLSYMISSSTSRPGTDSGYTVLDNGDGSYTAKFSRNIKAVTQVPYDATRTHRVAVQVRSAAASVLTDEGDTVTNFLNEKIMFYDFVPATPTVVPIEQRTIVKTEACAACHTKLGVTTPHGGRSEVSYCIMCHTAQRGNGRTPSTSTGGVFTGSTYIADGEVLGDIIPMIHKIHMGEELTKQGYNYANVLFNEVVYPQPITNCRTCHIEDTSATSIVPQSLNWKDKPSRKACGACHDNINWATGANSKPGGTAHIAVTDDSTCIGCHGSASPVYADKVHKPVVPPDPNNAFLNTNTLSASGATGNNNTNAGWLVGTHNESNLPAGVNRITYVVSSVTVDAGTRRPSIMFKLQKNGTDVNFGTYNVATNPELIPGYVGSPSVYFAWAVPQDGITAPADYNATASAYIKNLWRGDDKDAKLVALSGTSTAKGTLTGPDGSGYYTATLTNMTIPTSAVMLTGGVGYTYGLSTTQPLTQIDLPEYPYTPNSGRQDPNKPAGTMVNGGFGGIGGIVISVPDIWKVATGYTGRRLIVDDTKCDACHAQLGVGPTFHAGQRNDAQTCTFCHLVNRTNSGWPVNINYDVHAIHGAGKRINKFTWEATAGAKYWNVAYPGILNNCEGCHIPGMYDFSATTSASAVPNLLTTYAANGGIKAVGDVVSSSDPNTIASVLVATTGTEVFDATHLAISPFVAAGKTYGRAFSYNSNTGATTTPDGDVGGVDSLGRAIIPSIVVSPISAACSGCHDTAAARAHMQANGGTVFEPRTAGAAPTAKTEQCLLCHADGKTADIQHVHRWK